MSAISNPGIFKAYDIRGIYGSELDAETAESRYTLEPADEMSADRIFERRWALTLLEEVLGQIRREFTAAGKARARNAKAPWSRRTTAPSSVFRLRTNYAASTSTILRWNA